MSTHDLRAAYLSLVSEPGPTDVRTLVIIDAIDEIAPSQSSLKGLFPHRLGSSVYVIFSARTIGDRDHLRHVGLSAVDIPLTIRLERLDLRGIVALLRKAGGRAEPLAEDGQFAEALLETSEGDPFYLRFLAEDVRDGRIGPTNVSDTPRGLYDYLDLQFDLLSQCAQRQQQRDVLGYILTAKGPLSRAALIARVQGLDAINFDTTISGIRRFLLERGGELAFCHERFKEYFQHKAGITS